MLWKILLSVVMGKGWNSFELWAFQNPFQGIFLSFCILWDVSDVGHKSNLIQYNYRWKFTNWSQTEGFKGELGVRYENWKTLFIYRACRFISSSLRFQKHFHKRLLCSYSCLQGFCLGDILDGWLFNFRPKFPPAALKLKLDGVTLFPVHCASWPCVPDRGQCPLAQWVRINVSLWLPTASLILCHVDGFISSVPLGLPAGRKCSGTLNKFTAVLNWCISLSLTN